jgi:hypothetical protein
MRITLSDGPPYPYDDLPVPPRSPNYDCPYSTPLFLSCIPPIYFAYLARLPSPAYVQLRLLPEAHCMALAIWTISKQAHVAEIESLRFTCQSERSRNPSASSS